MEESKLVMCCVTLFEKGVNVFENYDNGVNSGDVLSYDSDDGMFIGSVFMR